MTIDEAIEIRENQVYLDPKFCSPKVLSAFKLGTEALIAWRQHRRKKAPASLYLLPGETEK